MKGFREEDGRLIDERPQCYVCGLPIDWEIERIKTRKRVGKTEIEEVVTIEVEPLHVGMGLYRHRGHISPKCEPDSDFYISKMEGIMRPDIRKALVEGKRIEKEKSMKKKEEEGKVAENMKARILDANKQLANAVAGGKPNLVEAYRKKVKKLVDEAGGAYTLDDDGYALQCAPVSKKKASAPKAEKGEKKASTPRPRKEAVLRACACGCGEMVGGFFKMGHDGRVKGQFLQVERGTMKEKDLNGPVLDLFKIHKANPGMSLRDVAETREKKAQKGK